MFNTKLNLIAVLISLVFLLACSNSSGPERIEANIYFHSFSQAYDSVAQKYNSAWITVVIENTGNTDIVYFEYLTIGVDENNIEYSRKIVDNDVEDFGDEPLHAGNFNIIISSLNTNGQKIVEAYIDSTSYY